MSRVKKSAPAARCLSSSLLNGPLGDFESARGRKIRNERQTHRRLSPSRKSSGPLSSAAASAGKIFRKWRRTKTKTKKKILFPSLCRTFRSDSRCFTLSFSLPGGAAATAAATPAGSAGIALGGSGEEAGEAVGEAPDGTAIGDCGCFGKVSGQEGQKSVSGEGGPGAGGRREWGAEE